MASLFTGTLDFYLNSYSFDGSTGPTVVMPIFLENLSIQDNISFRTIPYVYKPIGQSARLQFS